MAVGFVVSVADSVEDAVVNISVVEFIFLVFSVVSFDEASEVEIISLAIFGVFQVVSV